MKLLLMTIVSGIILLQNQTETISGIKANTTEIKGKIANSVYQQDRSQFNRFVSILNQDVPGFMDRMRTENISGIKSKSPDTSVAANNYPGLAELKNEMISATYYLDFVPDYLDVRSVSIKYDREARTFPITNEVQNSLFFDDPEFIQIDQFLFKCPKGISVIKKNINYSCVDMVSQTILFEVNDDALASRIEGNRDFLRLLFIFKITGTTIMPGKESVTEPTDYFFLTTLQKVIAYNSKTNEIYSAYTF